MLNQSGVVYAKVERYNITSSDSRYMKQKTCSVSANVQCKVQKDNSNCKDIIVKPGECGMVPVVFKFKYCNENKEFTVNFKKRKTVGKIYNSKVSVNTRPLPPLKCRTKKVDYIVDTCDRNRIHSQLKVEAKIPIYGENYCYDFFFYSKRIKKLQAIEIPTREPTIQEPNIELVLECYVESNPGSGIFDKECEDLDDTDFQASFDYRYLQDTSNPPEDDTRHMKFMFVHKFANKSYKDVFVDNFTVYFNDKDFVLLKGHNLTIPPFYEYSSEGNMINVDLNAGESFTISGEATAHQPESKHSIGVVSGNSIPLLIPFKAQR